MNDLIIRKIFDEIQNDNNLIENISIEIARALNLEGNNRTLGRKIVRMALMSDNIELFKEKTIEYGQIRKEILIEIFHRIKQKYSNLILHYKELNENDGIEENSLFGFSGKTEVLTSSTNNLLNKGGLRNKDTKNHNFQKPENNNNSDNRGNRPTSILGLDKQKSSRSKVGFSWNDDGDEKDNKNNDSDGDSDGFDFNNRKQQTGKIIIIFALYIFIFIIIIFNICSC